MDARKTAKPRSLGPAKTSGAPPRGTQTPSLYPPSEDPKEQWAVDPSDVRRHARLVRERERLGPLGKLVRYTTVVLLLAGAVAVYWNFDTLRGARVDFAGFVDLVARRVKDTVAATEHGATQTEVVKETEVVGTAAPSSLASAPSAAEPAVPEQATTTPPEPRSLTGTTSPEASALRPAAPRPRAMSSRSVISVPAAWSLPAPVPPVPRRRVRSRGCLARPCRQLRFL